MGADKKLLLSVFASGLVGVIVGGTIVTAVVAPYEFSNIFSGAGLSGVNLGSSSSTAYVSDNSYEQDIINVASALTPSVVSVVISQEVPNIEECPYNPFADLPPEFQNLFGGGTTQYYTDCQEGSSLQEIGSGSGFIITSDGYILTNKHVVDTPNAQYTVFTNDGKEYTAKVVATDPTQDIAIIKINATGLTPVTLGDSSGVELGETTIAIGNALGEFRNTVSIGSISGLERTISAADELNSSSETLSNVIQTTSAINPGNSGGPLLNLKGQVIGIDTAVDTSAQSIGFAIPINDAKKDITSVLATGQIKIPYLGVRYEFVTPDLVTQYSLTATSGALLEPDSSGDPAIAAGSPAAKAGLKQGDVILSVDGTTVDNANNTLSNLIESYNVGDTITLQVERGSKIITVSATLAEFPSSS